MHTRGYLAAEKCCSSDLVRTAVALNDQNVARLEPPPIYLRGVNLEIARVGEIEPVPMDVGYGEVTHGIVAWDSLGALLNASPNFCELLDRESLSKFRFTNQLRGRRFPERLCFLKCLPPQPPCLLDLGHEFL